MIIINNANHVPVTNHYNVAIVTLEMQTLINIDTYPGDVVIADIGMHHLGTVMF